MATSVSKTSEEVYSLAEPSADEYAGKTVESPAIRRPGRLKAEEVAAAESVETPQAAAENTPGQSGGGGGGGGAVPAPRERSRGWLSRILLKKPPAPAEEQAQSDEPAAASSEAGTGDQARSANADAGATKPAPKRLRKRSARWGIPAWGVSVLVHGVILGLLGAATLHEQIRAKLIKLNSSMLKDPSESAAELTKIYADPSDSPRDKAVGDEFGDPGPGAPSQPPAGLALSGGGLASPSATPRVSAVGKVGARGGSGAGAGSGLSNLKVISQVSGLSLLPAMPGKDLSGGGKIAGDVTFESGEIGQALDQLAREILRNLNEHKITVVWLFDESESMQDDQKIIKQKFNKVADVLKSHVDSDRKSVGALTHVVAGFGKDVHFPLAKPTSDISVIGKAIDRLRIDETGIENTCSAIQQVMNRYGNLITKDRRLLIVLVTDESGDDGAGVEEARQMVVSRRTPVYILGRQALFGYPFLLFEYVDPITKDVFWPTIRRGPETAGLEVLQWDGLQNRIDELPSGFAPYELARLAKESGGIYFLLPSEETLRIHKREKAYSIKSMKEYIPDYESRLAYEQKLEKSRLRRTLHEIIEATRSGDFNYRLAFPVLPNDLVASASAELPKVKERLAKLLSYEDALRKLAVDRDRETDKRWKASYDLTLAQVVAYEIVAYEYGACLEELIKKRPKPSELPNPKLSVEWRLGHSKKPMAPKTQTEKKYVEAERLAKLVIERHPNTPWSDLAQMELDRGFSVGYGEAKWRPSPSKAERAKFVPKY